MLFRSGLLSLSRSVSLAQSHAPHLSPVLRGDFFGFRFYPLAETYVGGVVGSWPSRRYLFARSFRCSVLGHFGFVVSCTAHPSFRSESWSWSWSKDSFLPSILHFFPKNQSRFSGFFIFIKYLLYILSVDDLDRVVDRFLNFRGIYYVF